MSCILLASSCFESQSWCGGGRWRLYIWWNREWVNDPDCSLQRRCHSPPITDGNLFPLLYFPLPVCTSDGWRPQQWHPLRSQQPVIMTSSWKTSSSDQTPNKTKPSHTQTHQTRGKRTYSWRTMNREWNVVRKRLLQTWGEPLHAGNFC